MCDRSTATLRKTTAKIIFQPCRGCDIDIQVRHKSFDDRVPANTIFKTKNKNTLHRGVYAAECSDCCYLLGGLFFIAVLERFNQAIENEEAQHENAQPGQQITGAYIERLPFV